MRLGAAGTVGRAALWLGAVYLAFCLLAIFGHRLFMYFPDPTRVAPDAVGLVGVSEVELEAPDGTLLVAWHAPAKADKPTLLYFHGNGANAANRAPRIAMMQEDGFGVFYLNNRGYGGSGGSPTEARNVADALLAYDHVRGLGVPADKIVAFGESLGSGQAVRVAGARPVLALVLDAPLTSTIDIGRAVYFWLPLRMLVADQYDVERAVPDVTAPVLILHGDRDRVIPVSMGKRVFAAANEPKELALFPDGGHLDFFDRGGWERTREFLSGLAAE